MDGLHNSRMGSRRKELTAPCMGCTDRKPGCHDSCERYSEFQKINEQKREYERENRSREIWDPMAPKRKRDL